MSFLAVLDEEMLTLEAALEFIESCGDDADLSSDSLSDSSGKKSPPAAASSDDDDRKKAAAGRTKKPSVVVPAATRKPSASTQQQRRRKQEIQSLREQAGELEAHLAQLKRRHTRRLGGPSADAGEIVGARAAFVGPQPPGPMVKKQKTSSVWMDLATIQFRERQRAELLNRKLKSIWTNQSKLNDSIQQILQKRSTFAVSCRAPWLLGDAEIKLGLH